MGKNKVPFFSKRKFIEALEEKEKQEVLLRELDNTSHPWFDMLDGEELKPFTKQRIIYVPINQKYKGFIVEPEWIEWK